MSKSLDRLQTIKELQELVKPGDTVYTILRHVSRSGMSRTISVQVLKDNEPRYLSYKTAQVLDWPFDEKTGHQAVKVTGAGMDMGFHLVYVLSRWLYPIYDCIGDNCPSADHVNPGDCQNNKVHKDGYALKQRWL